MGYKGYIPFTEKGSWARRVTTRANQEKKNHGRSKFYQIFHPRDWVSKRVNFREIDKGTIVNGG